MIALKKGSSDWQAEVVLITDPNDSVANFLFIVIFL